MGRPRPHQLIRSAAIAVGLLALTWTIWSAGPGLHFGDARPLESPTNRWLAVAAVIVAGTAAWGWRVLRARRREDVLVDGISAGEREAQVLDARFTEALAALRRHGASLGKGRTPRSLYDLPWYVIIGAPGSGKTTALLNAGLEFPLAGKFGPGALRGAGGTRNCDWWFTSEAVLIDTAGRYTTHESDRAADSTAWAAFLSLLARHRPQRPINGLLLAISTSDLFQAGPAERAEHAAKLRARIAEIHATLQTRVPVYVLVTKIDLLAGFVEFFGDFDKDERAQVWGVSFPGTDQATTAGLLATLPTELSLLGARLDRTLLDRLHDERDLGRRAALYRFPQQWHGLKELLPQFLQQVFMSTESTQTLLRGVYFTSGTQEGTPIDRALGGLARALGLASRVVAPERGTRASGRSYFLTRLLHDVVFAEAEVAGTNRRWQLRRNLLQWSVVGGTVGAAALAVVGLWWQSSKSAFELDRWAQRLERVDALVAGARSAGVGDVAVLLPLLQSVHDLSATEPAGAWTWGLDHAASLAAAADAGYHQLLRQAFVPSIAAGLEQRMRSAPAGQVAMLYEALKAYVMLYSGRNFDRDALRAYLIADWQSSLPRRVDAEQRKALAHHLDRLLDTGEVGAPSTADSELLAVVRQRVAATPLPALVYNRLVQIDSHLDLAPFDLARAAGPQASGVIESAAIGSSALPLVPGAFTLAGYQRLVHERAPQLVKQFSAERTWVLGSAEAVSEPGAAALTEGVQALYFSDHGAAWEASLNSVRLARATSLSASAQLAGALARPDSPLVALVTSIARELSLGDRVQTRLSAPSQALQRFGTQRPGALDELLTALGKLAPQLAAFEDAIKRDVVGAVPNLGELAALLPRLPEPLRAWMGQLHADVANQLAGLQREAISQHVRREVLPICTQSIAGRYPIVRASREEVARQDFVRVFGANGVIDATFRRHLANWVDTRAQPWSYRGSDGARGESTDSLRQFQRARLVRDAFFSDEGKTLGASLQWRLMELDAGIRQFTIEVDGQSLRFAADAKTAASLLWPGPDGEAGVRVQVQTAAGTPSTFTFPGPWALLRLLDRARVEVVDPARIAATFDVEGRRARFEISARSGANPLRLNALEQFECPQR